MPIPSLNRMDLSILPEPTKTPEERLMAAVLEEALATFTRGLHSRVPRARQDHCDVDRWIRCRDSDDLFSFDNVCAILGIDADYLRAGLARMKTRVRTDARLRAVRKLRRPHISDRRIWKGHIGA